MNGLPGRTLVRELSETFLLLAVSGLTLGGYLGLALLLLKAL